MGTLRECSQARLKLTNDTHNVFRRPHWRVCDIMEYFEVVYISKVCSVEEYLLELPNRSHDFNYDCRGLVNVGKTLGTRSKSTQNDSFADKQPAIDRFMLTLDDMSKEDVIALRLARQILLTEIMFNEDNQKRELRTATGEAHVTTGLVCEHNFLIVSPCHVNGNFTPLVAKSDQVRYNKDTKCIDIMDVHETKSLFFKAEYLDKKLLQATLKKKVWDRSWHTLANPTSALGADVNNQLHEKVADAIHKARGVALEEPKWITLSDVRKGGADRARTMKKLHSIAMVRYVYKGTDSEAVKADGMWKYNDKLKKYYRDFTVKEEFEKKADDLVREFFRIIARPVVKAERKRRLDELESGDLVVNKKVKN